MQPLSQHFWSFSGDSSFLHAPKAKIVFTQLEYRLEKSAHTAAFSTVKQISHFRLNSSLGISLTFTEKIFDCQIHLKYTKSLLQFISHDFNWLLQLIKLINIPKALYSFQSGIISIYESNQSSPNPINFFHEIGGKFITLICLEASRVYQSVNHSGWSPQVKENWNRKNTSALR